MPLVADDVGVPDWLPDGETGDVEAEPVAVAEVVDEDAVAVGTADVGEVEVGDVAVGSCVLVRSLGVIAVRGSSPRVDTA